MKLKVMRTAILTALQTVQGIVGSRATIPILSNVLLKAEKDKLILTTTDLEVAVKCAIAADVSKTGESTLPARRLMGIIRELGSDEVDIEVDEKHLAVIKSGNSLFKVFGLSGDEFPPLANYQSGFSFSVEQSAFKQMLTKIAYSASADETRYVLNGVYLNLGADKMTMVATDGRRLALVEQELDVPKESEMGVIIPSKAVNELLQSLKEEGQVKVYCSPKQLGFEFGDVIMVSKLIEGNYPNYKQVIPAKCEERVELERESLLTAVRRAALITSDKSNSVKLTFTKNKLKISVVTPDVGEAHESMAIKYSGKEISVAFNPEYLMDPLRRLANDIVYMEISDDLSPGVLKCDQPFLYVLMPMRVGN